MSAESGVWQVRTAAGARRPWAFVAAVSVTFAAAAVGTVAWAGAMAGGMPMPGGWTMSMAWMRMPGQGWVGAAMAFLAMWLLMMVAMMLPSLVPVLWSARGAAAERGAPGRLAELAAGYFTVWAGIGLAVYPVGVAVAAAEMRWEALARAAPAATGAVLLAAGLFQLSGWKARALAGCCPGAGCALRAEPSHGPFRQGVRVGARCGLCCAGFTAALLALGVMDLGPMAACTAAITAERLSPSRGPVARALGVALIAAGALVFAMAMAG